MLLPIGIKTNICRSIDTMPPRRRNKPAGDDASKETSNQRGNRTRNGNRAGDRDNNQNTNNDDNQAGQRSEAQNAQPNDRPDVPSSAEIAEAEARGMPVQRAVHHVPGQGVVLVPRKFAKKPGEYSTNTHTQRVRVRNAGITPYQRAVEQARSADLKAVAEKWRFYANTDRYKDLDRKTRAQWLDDIEKDVLDARRKRGLDYDSKISQLNRLARPEDYADFVNPGAQMIGGPPPKADPADRPGKSGENVAPIEDLMTAKAPLRLTISDPTAFGSINDMSHPAPGNPSVHRSHPPPNSLPPPNQHTQGQQQPYQSLSNDEARAILDRTAQFVPVNPDTPYVDGNDPNLRRLITTRPAQSWESRAPIAQMHEPRTQIDLTMDDNDDMDYDEMDYDNGNYNEEDVGPSSNFSPSIIENPFGSLTPSGYPSVSPRTPVRHNHNVPGQHLIHPRLRTQPARREGAAEYPYPTRYQQSPPLPPNSQQSPVEERLNISRYMQEMREMRAQLEEVRRLNAQLEQRDQEIMELRQQAAGNQQNESLFVEEQDPDEPQETIESQNDIPAQMMHNNDPPNDQHPDQEYDNDEDEEYGDDEEEEDAETFQDDDCQGDDNGPDNDEPQDGNEETMNDKAQEGENAQEELGPY
ncbi:hypothetical protein GGR57DRAFT_513284 [Xylariaceae sp. FL1272]|nr:hypothetical protein GGR57DRAFT_513284 [Xylariaceae sp. FL1272]